MPIDDWQERELGYHPPKGAALLGFVPAEGPDAPPRHYLGCGSTKGCFAMLGDGDADAAAVSALARAMAREKMAARERGGGGVGCCDAW